VRCQPTDESDLGGRELRARPVTVQTQEAPAGTASLRSAFPDWNSTPEELIAEDDRVAERWTGRGTHQGEFQGISATGRQVVVPGFVFYHVTSGKIAEFRGVFDGLSMLHQLGAMPPSQQDAA
jgi:SnoaL-like polyketide cyclase